MLLAFPDLCKKHTYIDMFTYESTLWTLRICVRTATRKIVGARRARGIKLMERLLEKQVEHSAFRNIKNCTAIENYVNKDN